MKNYDVKIDVGNISVYAIKTGRWRENAYVAFNNQTSRLIVIDPGGEEIKIEKCVKELKSDIDGIYLTHAHHDHVGALNYLCSVFNKNFFMEQSDYKIFRRAPTFALSFESRELKIPSNREVYYDQNFYLNEDVNGVHCIKSPGHTAGSVVIRFGGVAFTGDTLLNRLVGRTDLPGADPKLLASSIENFLELLNHDVVLFPGHGNSWTVKEALEWWSVNSHSAPEYREE